MDFAKEQGSTSIGVEDCEGPIDVALTTEQDELIKRSEQQVRASEAKVQQLKQHVLEI